MLDISQYTSPLADADVRERIERSLAEALEPMPGDARRGGDKLPPSGIDWDLPLDHLSASSIEMWFRCKFQWQQRYIHGRKERPGEAPVMGTAVHAALERNFKPKIETHADLALVDLIEWYMDIGFVRVVEHEQERAGVEVQWDTGPEATRQRGKHIVAAYHDNVSPRIQPLKVEQVFEVDMGLPVPVRGRVDLEMTEELLDWKTGKQTTRKPKEGWRLQGGVYRIATGKPVAYHSLSASPKSNAVTIVTPLEEEALLVAPTEIEIAEMKRTLRGAAAEMNLYMRLYGPDEPWTTNGTLHSWACGYCSYLPGCPAWQGRT